MAAQSHTHGKKGSEAGGMVNVLVQILITF